MMNLMDAIHFLLPFLGCLFFLVGIRLQRKNYIVASLWLSLIALALHYRASGGEILGSYFNYTHAIIYSLNLIILLAATIYLLFSLSNNTQTKLIHYSTGLLSACLITGLFLLLGNLWVNAVFVENRLPGTPILQVASFNKQPYCDYKYVFYKIGPDSIVRFMCPNHYGLLPSVGRLDSAPGFVVKQLPIQLQNKFKQESDSL